jgi:hypothetical protein
MLNKRPQKAKIESAAKRDKLMTTFDKREQAFESQLAHDAELKFKAVTRRDKWFGLWAAGQLGKTAGEAEAYAVSLVKADITGSGGDEVFEKVRADLAAAGVALSDLQIRRKLEDLLVEAVAAVKAGD